MAKEHGDTSKEELQAQGAAKYTALLLPVRLTASSAEHTWAMGRLVSAKSCECEGRRKSGGSATCRQLLERIFVSQPGVITVHLIICHAELQASGQNIYHLTQAIGVTRCCLQVDTVAIAAGVSSRAKCDIMKQEASAEGAAHGM